jgi:hypothetical protein
MDHQEVRFEMYQELSKMYSSIRAIEKNQYKSKIDLNYLINRIYKELPWYLNLREDIAYQKGYDN